MRDLTLCRRHPYQYFVNTEQENPWSYLSKLLNNILYVLYSRLSSAEVSYFHFLCLEGSLIATPGEKSKFDMNNRIRQETTWEKNELGKRKGELEVLKKRLSRMERILTKLRLELGTLKQIYSEILDPRIRVLDALKSNQMKLAETGRRNIFENEASHAGTFSYQGENGDDEDSLLCDDISKNDDYVNSFKDLYRKVAKAVHPDLATNEEEKKWRQKLMAEANNAYTKKDYESLRSILRQWENNLKPQEVKDICAELSLIMRKISWTKERIRVVEADIEELKNSDLYRLLIKVEEAQYEGVDLLAEMAKKIDLDIESIRKRMREDATYGEGNNYAGGKADRLERSVCFPYDYAAGKLFYRKSGSESFLDWKFYGEALGEIRISTGKTLRLDVSDGRGNALSFLDTLGENDLQAIFLHGSSDNELSHLHGLTGLREIYLSGKGITDAGIYDLWKLKNLHRLYLYDTAITDNGAEALKGLTGLRCITFCGSGVTENIMGKIKNFLPGCRIILLNRPSAGTGKNSIA
jgi:hypothetical protein